MAWIHNHHKLLPHEENQTATDSVKEFIPNKNDPNSSENEEENIINNEANGLGSRGNWGNESGEIGKRRGKLGYRRVKYGKIEKYPWVK